MKLKKGIQFIAILFLTITALSLFMQVQAADQTGNGLTLGIKLLRSSGRLWISSRGENSMENL